MVLYVPREIKQGEGRVAAQPEEIRKYRHFGGFINVESGAGTKSGFSNSSYGELGASIVIPDLDLIKMGMPPFMSLEPDEVIILKVKEVILPDERWMIREDHAVVGFGHLAANRALVDYTIRRRGTYVSLEDIVEPGNPPVRPVLKGMSVVAGKEAVKIGMKYFSETTPCVVIVGYGNVGKAAHETACEKFDLPVIAFDRNPDVLKISATASSIHKTNQVCALFPDFNIDFNEKLRKVSVLLESSGVPQRPYLIILSPYAPENKAPTVITMPMLQNIPQGSVIVDVSIDQGGACEFSRPTSHEHPATELERGIKYIGIPNLPGGVPEESTPVFSQSVYPYIADIVRYGFVEAIRRNRPLFDAVSIFKGRVTSAGLAKTFELEYTPLAGLLNINNANEELS